MSGWSVNLTTLFLRRLRPPKRLTSTLCTYFCQSLTTALLESAERETKSMRPDQVSNPGPLALKSDMLQTVLRGPATRSAPKETCLQSPSMKGMTQMTKHMKLSYQMYQTTAKPESCDLLWLCCTCIWTEPVGTLFTISSILKEFSCGKVQISCHCSQQMNNGVFKVSRCSFLHTLEQRQSFCSKLCGKLHHA